MFLKLTLIIALCFSCANVFAKDQKEECGPAVDNADQLAAAKECDYSDTGLNGVLHRTLSGKKKSNATDDVNKDAQINKEQKRETEITKVAVEEKIADKKNILKADEFSSPQQLQTAKFTLLETLALECTKGFVVEGERYLPVKNSKALKLELIYHCL
ncbi:hypothetical protein GCM10011613_06900 [Cellvibrio zantedeschiae]|uniref:Secreted protein n=1 Tax=Cellvibrio zantedeschiae TaxID=1237077 RepID=A0ABQ3ATC7_9GAMM|nr:hypothetical protein [Cellvibrio zantedeschiae]GGY65639.1 hypothetical protein GCM10011613_06900 [Cellvibrio zantedeschiae]